MFGRLGALFFVICGVCIFLSLGFWQLDRLAWKRGLIEKMATEQSIDAKTVLLADLAGDVRNNLRRGYLRGVWMKDAGIQIGPKFHDDKWGNWQILPLQLDGGGIVMVNRGWAASDTPLPRGRVIMTGSLRVSEKSGPVAGDMRQWRGFDVAGMAQVLELRNVAPLGFFMEASIPADKTIAVPATQELRNEHLNYAIFWFTMAGLLPILALVFTLRERRSVASPNP